MAKPQRSPEFTMTVRRLGPIANATITMRPLTIIIGPNNAGKSYLTMLLHAVNKSLLGPSRSYAGDFEFYEGRFAGWRPTVQTGETRTLANRIFGVAKPNAREPTTVPPEDVKAVAQQLLGSFWLPRFESAFRESFGASLLDDGTFNCEVDFETDLLAWSVKAEKGHFTVRSGVEPRFSLKVRTASAEDKVRSINFSIVLPPGTEETVNFRFRDTEAGLPEYIWFEIMGQLASSVLSSSARRSHYLPAARSGLVSNYSGVVASLISVMPRVPFQGFHLEAMSGVVSEFLIGLVQGPGGRIEKNRPLEEIASFLEREALTMRVSWKTVGSLSRGIEFELPSGKRIPAHLASSGATELAPLVVYLRERIGKKDLIVIEEPEGHLHPANQQRVARAIAQIVGHGVQVVMTTHSDTVIEQTNNLIKGSSAKPPIIGALHPSDVAAYLFVKGPDGTSLQPLKIDETGIEQEEFVRVARQLSDEAARIELGG